ncbi:glucose PTS transporter subunit IIA [Leptotrichia sp. oral taxon 879]|uniref:PTS glucose transporter subunit IIA n=1 Tax=Leptotrichia mesophila TaxID=3239303 RepID=A0AB39VDG8_9FUSO|nr:glucose PTS transporter subunit IIA [Leptotrichia sp. oral taxon 879]ERK47396.1 glucose-specific phosphotransferase enzyme IIA component [Leptotrichia sp. oral taxon 879 str. F0557]
MGLFDLFKKGNKGEEVKQEFDGKVIAPISGNLLPLSEVPDEVFAKKMVGDGVAIEPNASGVMLAPASGRIEKIFDTNHAFSIVTPAGIEIFVHFGMDTVQLEGKGFERIAEEGAVVKVGDPLIKYDYDFLKANAKSIITPVIISNYESYSALNPVESGAAVAGETTVLNVEK